MEPQYVDYLWSTLEPWVHYIPVTEATFVNISKFVAADQNQELLRRIITNANIWCSKQMSKRKLKKDFLRILNSFVDELDRHDPSWLTTWKTAFVAYIRQGEREFFPQYRFHERALKAVSTELNPVALHVVPEPVTRASQRNHEA